MNLGCPLLVCLLTSQVNYEKISGPNNGFGDIMLILNRSHVKNMTVSRVPSHHFQSEVPDTHYPYPHHLNPHPQFRRYLLFYLFMLWPLKCIRTGNFPDGYRPVREQTELPIA